MKKGVDLIYKLNGNIENGIDVFELSPILLAFGKLINEAHKTLYPDEPEIAINIKPIEKGSFELSIWLFARDIIHNLINYINSDVGKKIIEVLVALGLIAEISGINLLKVISFFKGKKLETIEPLKTGEYKYTANDNSSITVPKKVHTLYQNYHIQQTIYNGIGKSLELNDVNSVDSYIKNEERTTKVRLERELVPAIKAYSASQIPLSGDDKIIENLRTLWVHPIRANLEGGSRSWSFRIGPETTLIANISDDIFLREIESGKIRLAQVDQLHVELLEKQIIRGQNISTSYEIIKIKEYIKGAEQEGFKFD